MEQNKIYYGDCLELIKELPDECVDAVITDPPYHAGLIHNGQKGSLADLNICRPFFRELVAEIKRVLKPDGFLYWFCDWRGYVFYYEVINGILPVRNLLVWDKVLGRVSPLYSMTHEFIIFAPNGKCRIPKRSIKQHAGFAAGAKTTDGERVHPTQKPIKLISELICDCTQEGDLVLDCFAGSSTTAVAAIYNKRNFICFELQEEYVEVSEKRIAEAKQMFDVPQGVEITSDKLF